MSEPGVPTAGEPTHALTIDGRVVARGSGWECTVAAVAMGCGVAFQTVDDWGQRITVRLVVGAAIAPLPHPAAGEDGR